MYGARGCRYRTEARHALQSHWSTCNPFATGVNTDVAMSRPEVTFAHASDFEESFMNARHTRFGLLIEAIDVASCVPLAR
jgi:hypothetical protein